MMTKEAELRNEILNLVEKYAENKYSSPQYVAGETVIPPSGKVI